MILLRVSLFFLVLLLLPDWYLYRYYIRPYGKNHPLRRVFWLPSLLLLLALVVFIIGWEQLNSYMGTYLIIALCIAIPKSLFALFHLLGRGLSALIPPLRGKKITRLSVTGNLLIALATVAYMLFGAIKGKEFFQVREVTFASRDLPAEFDGYQILQLSDMHTGSWGNNPAALEKAVRLCNAQQPDLAVFTGDLVNHNADEVLPFMQTLSKLQARDGVYSILGNHDYATYTRWDNPAQQQANVDSLIEREKRMGWQLLLNEHRIIRRGNDSIALVGVENSGNPPFPDRADLKAALKDTGPLFKVLLSHDPTHWRREVLPDTDIQLMLAGHTHDMQISVFGFSISRFIYPEHNGLYTEGGRGLYVNIGLGHILFPMRLGAWPEITLITLRKQQ